MAFLAQVVQSRRDMLGMLNLLPPTAGVCAGHGKYLPCSPFPYGI